MDITYRALRNGGRLTAVEGAETVGELRWRIVDGVWLYDRLWVHENHRREGVANELARAARERRGDAPWRNVPMTEVGRGWMGSYLSGDYEGTDPRTGENDG